MKKPTLTEPQQRHIETTMRLVDHAVQRVEFSLDRAVQHTGPSGIVSSLPEETLRQLRELLRHLQEEAVKLYRHYGGRPHRLSLDRVLDAELSSLWEMLEDTRPRGMRGYGPMEEETARQLETDIRALIELVQRARRILLSSHAPSRERPTEGT